LHAGTTESAEGEGSEGSISDGKGDGDGDGKTAGIVIGAVGGAAVGAALVAAAALTAWRLIKRKKQTPFAETSEDAFTDTENSHVSPLYDETQTVTDNNAFQAGSAAADTAFPL